MHRRRFLAATSAASAMGIAGCTSLFNVRQRAFSAPPLVKNRPDAVYYPTHIEKMTMSGMQMKKGYACALTYTYPHRFWLVTGTHTNEVTIKSKDTMHVMPVIWHAKTNQVLPDISPRIRLSKKGKTITNSPWPMLSQPMGWHFGDNIQLPGDGTYDVTVDVSKPSAKRIGSLDDAPAKLSFEFTMDYSQSKLERISWHKLDKKGKRGAVPHMNMMKLPPSTAPKKADLPGQVLGTGTSGDAHFAITILDDASRFDGGESKPYLAVSPHSPYNDYILPMMNLSATLDGSKHSLIETLAPDLGLHYGAVIDKTPKKATIHVDTPPQFARHEGYETAFLDMPSVTVQS